MIGCYIIARMAELISLSDRSKTVKVLASIALAVAIFSIIDLASSGTSGQMPSLP